MRNQGDEKRGNFRDADPYENSENFIEIAQSERLTDMVKRLREAGKLATDRIDAFALSPTMKINLDNTEPGLPRGTTSIEFEETTALDDVNINLRGVENELIAVLCVSDHLWYKNRIYASDLCQSNLDETPKFFKELENEIIIDFDRLAEIILEASIDTNS